MSDTLGDLIDKLTVSNIRLWHIEDDKREYCANPHKNEAKARKYMDLTATVNRERNSLIDQINSALRVLIDKISDRDSSFVVMADDLLGTGKNKYYNKERPGT